MTYLYILEEWAIYSKYDRKQTKFNLCSNDYTLQVGIFKNKASAEALLQTIQANHLPARIETN